MNVGKIAAALSLVAPAFAQAPSDLRVALPFDQVDTLDGVRFKIRVPGNWNGTLLVYLQGAKTGTPPPEPILTPPVLAGSQPNLDETLLSQGFALAASEIGNSDMQVKESVQDHLTLTSYFRGRIGTPRRVLLWGMSNGGLAALRLIEEFARSFDGAIAGSAPAAGMPRNMDARLAFGLAYAVVFGWPSDAWGPLEDTKPGLNFQKDVMPKAQWPKADGSNRGGWEFIRLVNHIGADAFWKTDPMQGVAGYLAWMLWATQQREANEAWAAGPIAQNLDHHYTLTPEEKTYLAGLGVNADDLLAKMNSWRIAASPWGRDYVERFGDVRGFLRRPVITLHTTGDGLADISHEGAYRAAVRGWGHEEYLIQAFVNTVGHCAFTSKQLLAAVAAMTQWLDSGVRPEPAAFPEAEGFDNSFVPPPWPY